MATAIDDLDLGALERDARSKIDEISEQMRRLAPEALTDEDVAREMRLLEGERRAAARVIEQARAARGELGRRDDEAQAQAEAEAREAALEKADALNAERLRAAQAVDAGLKRAAAAYADLTRLTKEQSLELQRAGQRGLWSPSKQAMNAALVFALSSVGVNSHQVFEFDWQSPKSLSDLLSPTPSRPPGDSTWQPPRGVTTVGKRSHLAGIYRQQREAMGISPEVAKRQALRHVTFGSTAPLEAEIAEIERDLAEAA
jgi:hypothetical protein